MKIKNKKSKAKKPQRSIAPKNPELVESNPEKQLQIIEARLMETAMTSTLALHLLRNKKVPAMQLLEELTSIESNAGQLVGAILKIQNESFNRPKARIAGALGFLATGSFKASSMIRNVEPIDADYKDIVTKKKPNKKYKASVSNQASNS